MLSITTGDASENITIFTLGNFNVIKDGQSLVASSAGAKKIWELYKFMLSHRERSFTPETLTDQLWVSEAYNDSRGTLRRQMHRLRQALCEDETPENYRTILFTNGYYKWNDLLKLELDTDIFERLIKSGDQLLLDSPKKALEAYQSALLLYVGDYLPECIDQHWVFPIRNLYSRLYLKTVSKTIELLKVERNFNAIISICENAIKIDIYEEAFHIHFMDALSSIGQQKPALEHYEYITGFYYREMGLKPSQEMKMLYKKLLQTHSPIQSKENLLDVLESDSILDNAFYCEPEFFKSIYELERRRSQRSGANFSIGVLTASPLRGYSQSQEELRISHLKQHLMQYLRKGDSFTRWNEQQFVVLLPGVDADLTEQVLKRVLSVDASNDSITINQIAHLVAEPQQSRIL